MLGVLVVLVSKNGSGSVEKWMSVSPCLPSHFPHNGLGHPRPRAMYPLARHLC
jgi:hypothetical protein